MDEEHTLSGGVANAGSVTKRGDMVLRPANPYSVSIHGYLKTLHDAGFRGAPLPEGMEKDGRERLRFIEGDVATPPYPQWAQKDDALASIALLIRKFHEASAQLVIGDAEWSDELADPQGGSVICHNDVCMENVVFRDGVAVALIDFDFAAPGRPIYDLAQFARMCVPMDAQANASLLGWGQIDKIKRLRLVADAYGLDADDRKLLLDIIGAQMGGISQFVQRRLDAGDPNFVKMWEDMGGAERFTRRREWFERNRSQFELVMVG